ncbi:MAG TPA: DUF4112 domain-containing protein [Burkholderiaceae bacterium]|nr:DUF4112 domain-containing protein [Burkholderiaceae bacterium]
MPVRATSAPGSSPLRETPGDTMTEAMTEAMNGVLSADPVAVRKRVEAMEALLEGLFVIPGTNFRVGLDALLGVLPLGGTVVAGVFGSWLAWEARNLGLPKSAYWRMAGNIAFDTALGAIPVVGTVSDVFFRSNTRNLKIIRTWLDTHHPVAVDAQG